jgi:hypothetical protein
MPSTSRHRSKCATACTCQTGRRSPWRGVLRGKGGARTPTTTRIRRRGGETYRVQAKLFPAQFGGLSSLSALYQRRRMDGESFIHSASAWPASCAACSKYAAMRPSWATRPGPAFPARRLVRSRHAEGSNCGDHHRGGGSPRPISPLPSCQVAQQRRPIALTALAGLLMWLFAKAGSRARPQ